MGVLLKVKNLGGYRAKRNTVVGAMNSALRLLDVCLGTCFSGAPSQKKISCGRQQKIYYSHANYKLSGGAGYLGHGRWKTISSITGIGTKHVSGKSTRKSGSRFCTNFYTGRLADDELSSSYLLKAVGDTPTEKAYDFPWRVAWRSRLQWNSKRKLRRLASAGQQQHGDVIHLFYWRAAGQRPAPQDRFYAQS